jgi:hypothetical protein
MMTLTNIVARPSTGSRRNADGVQLVLRVATALLITLTAGLLLIYADVRSGALPVDAELLHQLY